MLLKKIKKSKRPSVQKYRFAIQAAFAILCIWIGAEMFLFVRFLESGGTAEFFERPPGVDGFLPISSLMSVVLFIRTGIIHNAHPAGFFIFTAIVAVSFVFGKSFCSWLCPVGFLSEALGDLGEKIFRRRIKMPKFLDYPLRSLKYLLLGFFIYSIFIVMGETALKVFLDSEYNKVADIKMFYFFANISRFSLIVIGVLFVLSISFRGFWCRYLCPYGAFLGIMSLLSLFRIKRDVSKCTDCGLCTKACPSFIKVDRLKTVISDECTTCLNCVDACPVKDTLNLKPILLKQSVSRKIAAAAIALIFISVTAAGMLTGYWQNGITKEEYLYHQKYIEQYGHPTDTKSIDELNEEAKKQASGERK